jgi:hypothetical protein
VNNAKTFIIDLMRKPSATLGVLCDIILKNYEEMPSLEDVTNIVGLNGFEQH